VNSVFLTGLPVTRHLLLAFLLVVTPLLGQASPQKAPHPRKNVATIARESKGAVVSIVMADKGGQPIAQGSGFVVSRDGRIVTNYHVVKNGSSGLIKLPDGSFFNVDGVLAFDDYHDIAVIRAHGTNFKTLALGDSDRLQVGDEVVAIGSPLSLESTVSNGIVSGIRTVKKNVFDEMAPQGGQKVLQITAPISHGSSGGPLFNLSGEVVGITSAALVGGENLNFAVPINDARKLLNVPATQALLAFPNEPENEPQEHAAAQDPIILDEDGATGFAEVFAVEPACAGLTLMRPENAAEVYRPPARAHWIFGLGLVTADPDRNFISWHRLTHYSAHESDCNLGSGIEQCQDVDKEFHIYTLLQDSQYAAEDTRLPHGYICFWCTTSTPASLDAGVKAVCTLVKGGGGGQVK
jgi:S1-C subfamily serine protease